ncbi:MAG: DUF2202 domain-containing protein [Nanoarchaeota archaeon]
MEGMKKLIMLIVSLFVIPISFAHWWEMSHYYDYKPHHSYYENYLTHYSFCGHNNFAHWWRMNYYNYNKNYNKVYHYSNQLSEKEKKELLLMREEEKLARDVYLTLYNKWGLPIFKNIARSEQNHMDAVKVLIEKYGLEDPVEETNDEIGVFKNPELQQLYYQLVNKGSQSIEDALEVGKLIEEKDIEDLEKAISKTNHYDIKIIYNYLMRGSYHHLRAFSYWLQFY